MESIEIDCAPGTARPSSYINAVLEGTGLKADADNPGNTFFGCWTWYFDVPREKWEKEIQPIIIPRLKKLYLDGNARYCGW